MRLTFSLLLILFLASFLWVSAEISVFFYIANAIGLIGAVALTVATSYLGISLLRRTGLAARQSLFDMLRRTNGGFNNLQNGLRNGVIAALGAFLLILPGFLSDAIGLFFALASADFWWPASAVAERPKPDVIDLSPEDWHHLDAAGHLPKKP